MNFVFIACNKNKRYFRKDPSFIYRCENLSEGLKKNGHKTTLLHIKEFNFLKDYDVVIFHRPSYSIRLNLIVKLLKLRNIFIIYDVDDLIFDPKYFLDSPAIKNSILTQKKVLKSYRKNLKALKLFSNFSVSTKPLKKHIKRILPESKVAILPNAVYNTWKDIKNKKYNDNKKIISYFPGTKSHDKDFFIITKSLERFLKENKNIQIKIVGPLSFNLDIPNNQIICQEKVDFSKHHKNYNFIWVNLAPLERNAFTECKSALKVIEAGFFNIPTITVDNADTKRFKDKGALTIEKDEDLYLSLTTLLNKTKYSDITEKLKERILEVADVELISKQLLKFIYKNNNLQMARKARKKGFYTLNTLKTYQRAYLRNKKEKNYIEYCMFCRDLGYKLSLSQYKTLEKIRNNYKYKYNKNLNLLISEYKDSFYSSNPFLNDLFLKQNKIFNNFGLMLKNKKICIVGNSASLRNKGFGKLIDSHEIVIRFNNCQQKDCKSDLGIKTNIWVSAPNINFTVESQWIIISGPNMIYRGANWNRFNKNNENILFVPLDIWNDLVSILKAPPSAGILTIYWIFKILNSWKDISIIGFDVSSNFKTYHYSSNNHKASSRHNWEEERKTIAKWISNGLNNKLL